jgi:hypothetical protein
MLLFKKRRALIFLCLTLLLAALAILFVRLRESNTLARSATATSARMSGFPKIFLWAWERPEHLEFINPREVGVAFLASTITLRGDKVSVRPRLQPLKVPVGTTLIAVVRVESGREAQPVLSDEQRAELVEALARAARTPDISALQIDFDATESGRQFYRATLIDLRRRMPEGMPLSITALASWCIFDNWLDELPVDEAVPMLFRMGVDRHRINDYLQNGGEIRARLCRPSVGVSIDEAIAQTSSATRTYIFNPQSWTESSARTAIERIQHENPLP